MEELFNLLKEAENIKQNIKFTKICEAYNAADLKKTDLNGYNANTQSFRQYIKEIMDLLAKLNQEMEKIYKINDTMFSRIANTNNYAELCAVKNALRWIIKGIKVTTKGFCVFLPHIHHLFL